jgi:hypothetical protein
MKIAFVLGLLLLLQLEEENYRVILVNSYEIFARKIACEVRLVLKFACSLHDIYESKAKKRNYIYPNYVWIFYDWFPKNWWIQPLEDNNNCTDGEIADFLSMAISLRRYPLVEDVTSVTDAGIVSCLESNIALMLPYL